MHGSNPYAIMNQLKALGVSSRFFMAYSTKIFHHYEAHDQYMSKVCIYHFITDPRPAVSVLRAAGSPVRTAALPVDLPGSEGPSSTAALALPSSQPASPA